MNGCGASEVCSCGECIQAYEASRVFDRAPATHEHSPAAAADKSTDVQRARVAREAMSGINSVTRGTPPAPRPPLIYIAGPYRSGSHWQLEQNIRIAEAAGFEVALLGGYPIIPHSNTRGYFEDAQQSPSFWLEATLELMRRCDAIYLLPQWPMSSGARDEHLEAQRLAMPIFHDFGSLQVWIAHFPDVGFLQRPRSQSSASIPPDDELESVGSAGD